MQNFLQPVTLSANQVRLEPLAPQHEAGLRRNTKRACAKPCKTANFGKCW